MVKIIGIDPGLAETGIGIIRGAGLKVNDYSFGVINTDKATPLPERLDSIFAQILSILKDEKPDIMIVEDIFFMQKYPKAGIILGKVTGVILLAANQAGLNVKEIPVREAKQVLTGNGNASKLQLEEAVRYFLNISTPLNSYHVSDATALALIGLFRYQK